MHLVSTKTKIRKNIKILFIHPNIKGIKQIMNKPKIAIIGAGLAGLTTTFYLRYNDFGSKLSKMKKKELKKKNLTKIR